MSTKHMLCNSCNRTFLDTKGGGRCPYCGSFEVEVVGETQVEMDPPYKDPDPPSKALPDSADWAYIEYWQGRGA